MNPWPGTPLYPVKSRTACLVFHQHVRRQRTDVKMAHSHDVYFGDGVVLAPRAAVRPPDQTAALRDAALQRPTGGGCEHGAVDSEEGARGGQERRRACIE